LPTSRAEGAGARFHTFSRSQSHLSGRWPRVFVKLWSKNVSALFYLPFANRIRFILMSKCFGPTRHGFHFHIVCGVLHRLSFWLRRAGINFANSKAASPPTAAVPQRFGSEPADAFRGAASRAYDRLTTPIALLGLHCTLAAAQCHEHLLSFRAAA
jgi:hypothetical protein